MAKIVKNRGEYVVNVKELIASTVEDMISTSLFQIAPGSKCFVLENFETYILSEDNEWVILPKKENSSSPEAPEVDLTGYATEEWVNAKIALILNNPTTDLDSIAELADILEKGGVDLVEIRKILDNLTITVATNYAEQQTKNETFAESDKTLKQAIVNEVEIRTEADNKQQVIIDEHSAMLKDIAREGLYRAQEVRPLIDDDTSFAIKYDGAALNVQRRTDTNIVSVRLEGDDLILRKLSGDAIASEEITYGHSVAGQTLETGDNREKPLYLIGLDDYATSDSGFKIILDENNNGVATTSDCSDLNWKDEYANVIPCFRIVDYYYEVLYTDKIPASLQLLGGFFRKTEAGEWTKVKVGVFTDTMHQFHLSFVDNTVTVECPTWTECNGTYNFVEDENKGISIEGSEAFNFVKDDTGYVFTVKNLYHSAHIDSLSGECDVEIRQYDAWHDGHMEGDNPYEATIKVEYDKVINPCAYPRYFFVKNNDRILFYKAYNESWGWKSGPFGMVIEGGEFEKTTNINNPNAAVIKYIIDGNLLVTGAYEIQEVTLDELAAGRGTVITGNTPYATNPGTGWGTSNPSVIDNNKRLGMFSYLTDNHDFKKGDYVHPVGNYNVCKIERLPITLVDGSQVQLYEATIRGFETTLHGEHWEADSENGKMYIQFMAGRPVDDVTTLRLFYRTLTVGYDRNEDGTLSTRRRTWAPFTEITTNTIVHKLVDALQLQVDELKINLETEITNRIESDRDLFTAAQGYTNEQVGKLEKHLNEDFVALTGVVADIKQPIYFDEYTSENKLYSWSDIYKLFRKSTRGNMNEKVYIHAWVDYCGFNEDNDYGFSLINNDGVSAKVREFKGVFLVGPNGIVEDSDNKVTYYLANGTDSGDSSVTPIAFVEETYIITQENSQFLNFAPCVGMTIDVPAFRMNSTTTQRTYEVTNATDLKNAIADAPAGSTIVISENIVSDSSDTAAFTINKPLTIVGDGNTTISSSTNKKLFEVYADVTLENLVLENVAISGRCVDTRTDDITVTLKGCTIKAANNNSNVQPVTIGGYNTDGLTVNIINCTIDAGQKGYGIIAFVPATVNIINSIVTGYAAIYTKEGSEGIIFNVQNSNLTSENNFNAETNEFGTLALETTNATINIDKNSTISALAYGTQQQYLINPQFFDESNVIKVEGETLAEIFTSNGYTIASTIDNWNTIGNPIKLEITAKSDVCTITNGKCRATGEFSPAEGEISFDIIVTDYTVGNGGQFYTIENSSVTGNAWEATIALSTESAGTPYQSSLQVKLDYQGQEKILLIPIE